MSIPSLIDRAIAHGRGRDMKKDYLILIASEVIWGLLPVFWHLLDAVPAVYLLATRILWSFVFCAIVLALRHGLGEVRGVFRSRKTALTMCLSSLMVTINWGLYIYSVTSGHMLEASLAYFINPILSVLLGAMVLGEKLTKLQMGSVLVAAAGIAISIVGYGSVPWLSLMIAASFAAYSLLKKRISIHAITSTGTEAMIMMPLSLAFILFFEFSGGAVIGGTLQGWQLLLLPAAGVFTAVPLILFSRGMQGTPLSLAGILGFVSPLLQFILGAFVYNEEVSTSRIVTFVFVWVAVCLYMIENLREHAREKRECKS